MDMNMNTGFIPEHYFAELSNHYGNVYERNGNNNFRYFILYGECYMTDKTDENVRVHKGITCNGELKFIEVLSESETSTVFKEFFYQQLRA